MLRELRAQKLAEQAKAEALKKAAREAQVSEWKEWQCVVCGKQNR